MKPSFQYLKTFFQGPLWVSPQNAHIYYLIFLKKKKLSCFLFQTIVEINAWNVKIQHLSCKLMLHHISFIHLVSGLSYHNLSYTLYKRRGRILTHSKRAFIMFMLGKVKYYFECIRVWLRDFKSEIIIV